MDDNGQPTGLILQHAYAICAVVELFDKKKPIRLLRLRNPWGHTEWTGAWSGDSAEMEKYSGLVQDYINSLPPDEQFDMNAEDGAFFIHYDDWKEHFSTLFLNNDFPEDWTGVRFKSKWTEQSGGIPARNEKELKRKYCENPQFIIKPLKNDCEVMFSMTQTGGRLPQQKGQYFEYPFIETMNYANLTIFKLAKNEKYLSEFDPQKVVYVSPIKRERENSGRCKLKKGEKYVIVCSTEMGKKPGDLYLSVYFNQYMRDVEIKRTFHPSDKT